MSGASVDHGAGFARHPFTIAIIAGLLSLLGVAAGLYANHRSEQKSSRQTDAERARDRLSSVYQGYLEAAYAYRGALDELVTKNQDTIVDAVRAEVDRAKTDAPAAYVTVLNNLNPTERAAYLHAYGLVLVYGSVQANTVARTVDATIYPMFVLPGKVKVNHLRAAGCSLIPHLAISLVCRQGTIQTEPTQTFGTPDAEFYNVRIAAFQNVMCTEVTHRTGAGCTSPAPSPTE